MNTRWIPQELKQLNSYMDMLHTDMRAGNKKSFETNWELAIEILKSMRRRENQSLRGMDKMGATAKFIYKKMKPLLREAAKEAFREYIREEARK